MTDAELLQVVAAKCAANSSFVEVAPEKLYGTFYRDVYLTTSPMMTFSGKGDFIGLLPAGTLIVYMARVRIDSYGLNGIVMLVNERVLVTTELEFWSRVQVIL